MLVRVRKMSTTPIEKKAASSSMPQAVMLKPHTCRFTSDRLQEQTFRF
jgi:hypothetical protein